MDGFLEMERVREDEADGVRDGAELGGEEEDAEVELGDEGFGRAAEPFADCVEEVGGGDGAEVAG